MQIKYFIRILYFAFWWSVIISPPLLRNIFINFYYLYLFVFVCICLLHPAALEQQGSAFDDGKSKKETLIYIDCIFANIFFLSQNAANCNLFLWLADRLSYRGGYGDVGTRETRGSLTFSMTPKKKKKFFFPPWKFYTTDNIWTHQAQFYALSGAMPRNILFSIMLTRSVFKIPSPLITLVQRAASGFQHCESRANTFVRAYFRYFASFLFPMHLSRRQGIFHVRRIYLRIDPGIEIARIIECSRGVGRDEGAR